MVLPGGAVQALKERLDEHFDPQAAEAQGDGWISPGAGQELTHR